jgi:hypothetical protein
MKGFNWKGALGMAAYLGIPIGVGVLLSMSGLPVWAVIILLIVAATVFYGWITRKKDNG